MLFFGNDFGGHVQGGPTKLFIHKFKGIGNMNRISEVNQIDVSCLINDDIVQFDIPMGNVLLMANFNRFNNFQKNLRFYFTTHKIVIEKGF